MGVDEEEANRFISRYTKGLSSELSYGKFLQFMLPYDYQLRFYSVQKPTHDLPPLTRLNLEIEKSLSNLFKTAIEVSREIELHKRTVRSKKDFDLCKILAAVDSSQESCINEENVRRFLVERGYKDVSELFVRHLDIDMDGILSYAEFEESLKPYDPMATCSNTSFSAREPRGSFLITPKIRVDECNSERSNEVTTAASHRLKFRKEFLPKLTTSEEAKTKQYYHQMDSRNKKAEIEKEHKYLRNVTSKKLGEEELVAALREQLRLVSKLEQQKALLALQPDFTIVQAYKEFDKEGKCEVSWPEFKDVLELLGVYKPEEDIKLLYERYGGKKKMRYVDFSEMMMPADAKYAIVATRRNFVGKPAQGLTASTRVMLKEFFKTSVETERIIESIRKRLKRSTHFDVHEGFELFGLSKTSLCLDDVNLPTSSR